MKTINLDGITYIQPVPGATSEWYYGISYEQGDLYEAEEIFRNGYPVHGRNLRLVHYPDGEVFIPIPKVEGEYCETPVFLDGGIYILKVLFPKEKMQIVRFDSTKHSTEIVEELPLSSVKDCYNLRLHISPLTLTRQCVGENAFEIIWPEKVSFRMGDHESFDVRDGDRLFFNRWNEEGEGENYSYSEETVIRDLKGNTLEIIPGDVVRMPSGELWQIK